MSLPRISKRIYLNPSYQSGKNDKGIDAVASSLNRNFSSKSFENSAPNRYRLDHKHSRETVTSYVSVDGNYGAKKESPASYQSSTIKRSKYKWENKPKNEILPFRTEHRHAPSIPFQSVLTKGWFSRPPCDFTSLLNLQTCCFISEPYLPSNTLSLDYVAKKPPSNEPLISVSKHKLIRKREVAVQKRQPFSSFSLCTQRKLIRGRSNDDKNVSKKKRIGSQFVLLTKRKLVRKRGEQPGIPDNTGLERKGETKTTATVELQKSPIKKSNSSKSSGKLVRVGHNRLIRSSLLSNTTKGGSSMLSHIIQYRRVPYSSSYVLLTRNKLIRKLNESQIRTKADNVHKGRTPPRKTFVSLGKTKLMRKSLFKKTNKPTTNENSEHARVTRKEINSSRLCGTLHYRSAQRFINHWSRRNLKFLSLHSSLIAPHRFGNKCKNNKRILRKRRGNTICPTFRKTGVCQKRTESGGCVLLHDRKYVSLCQNSIRGVCNNNECKLSHDLIAEKMPTCLHFLRGDCQHENCVYLHKKPDNPEAPICSKFLRGYCSNGDACNEWHVYACPAFKKDSKCPKDDKCRLPHRDAAFFEDKVKDNGDDPTNEDDNWRYFETNEIQMNENDNGCTIIPNRDNSGKMGDFIPL